MYLYLIISHVWVFCLHAYKCTTCLPCAQDRRWIWIPQDWHYRQLWAFMWVMRIYCWVPQVLCKSNECSSSPFQLPNPGFTCLFQETQLWIWLEKNESRGLSHKINPKICQNCFSLLRRTQTPRSPFSKVFFSGSHPLLVESQQPQTWDHSQTRETRAILGKTIGGCFGDGAHRLPWQPNWLNDYYFKC